LVSFEYQLVKAFGWSLHDIDETDVDSLVSFVYGMMAKNPSFARKQAFCDQVDWL
jgi:hypothetical protein